MDSESPQWHHYWMRFYRLYKPLIYSVAAKSGIPQPDIEDVVQDIFTELQRQFQKGDTDGARYDLTKGRFRSYLMRLVKWRVTNRRERRPRDAAQAATLEETLAGAGNQDDPDPFENLWQDEEERVFIALAKARIQAPLEHLQIWDCLVEKGMSADQTAKLFDKKRGHIDTIKSRMAKKLQDAVRALRAQQGF